MFHEIFTTFWSSSSKNWKSWLNIWKRRIRFQGYSIDKTSKRTLSALAFMFMNLRKIFTLCVGKYFQKTLWYIIIRKKRQKHYVLIKDFNTFMYDHTLHHGRKHFCRYCLQAFSTEEILKCHVNNCFENNSK